MSLWKFDPANIHPTVSNSPEFAVLLHGKSASFLKQVSCEVDPPTSRFLSCAVNRQAPEVGGRAEVVETGAPGHAIGFKMRTHGVRGGHDVVGRPGRISRVSGAHQLLGAGRKSAGEDGPAAVLGPLPAAAGAELVRCERQGFLSTTTGGDLGNSPSAKGLPAFREAERKNPEDLLPLGLEDSRGLGVPSES